MAEVNKFAVIGNGNFGGVEVTISPFYRPDPTSNPTPTATDISSSPTKAASSTITLTFSKSVDYISVTAKNAIWSGNRMVAYDIDGNVLADVAFSNNIFALLGYGSTDTKAITAQGIRRVELIPREGSYLFYGDIEIHPEDVAVTNDIPTNSSTLDILIPMRIRIVDAPKDSGLSIPIRLSIYPEPFTFTKTPIQVGSILLVNPIPIELENIFRILTKDLVDGKISSYFDQDRELKTVLNFDDDRQFLLTNWMGATAKDELLVKLYEPLPVDLEEKDQLWISTEIAPTYIDKIVILPTVGAYTVYYLRPPNRNAAAESLYGIETGKVTLNTLIPSASIQLTSSSLYLQNDVLEKYFTTDLAGAELNIDYTNYLNFVHFSSAEARLQVFREKLIQIESINSLITSQSVAASASLASTTITHISGTAQYGYLETLYERKQDIIRSFDGYEYFLYYLSGSFSGSLSGLYEDESLYISDVSWPKDSNNAVLSVTSSTAIDFYDYQSEIARAYDNQNADRLVYFVPSYLLDDDDSLDYLTFLNMIGHHFDLIKIYIDKMTDIYNRSVDPKEGLSKNLIWTVAESLGVDLPNPYSIMNLVNTFVSGAAVSDSTYDSAITETWKRFLHTQLYLAKTKGTAASISALRNIYGVLPEVVRIRESMRPTNLTITSSIEALEEASVVLAFDNGTSYVEMPFSGAGYIPSSVELRFATEYFESQSLLESVGGDWSVQLIPSGSSEYHKGAIQFISGSTTVLSSTVGKFYNGDFYTLLLRRNTSSSFDLTVKQYEQEIYSYSYGPTTINSSSISDIWLTSNIYLGGPSTNAFSGSIDEVRIWSEVISDSLFSLHTRYPGMYAGASGSSAKDNLIVRLSFNYPKDLNADPYLINESPYATYNPTPAIVSMSAANFSAVSAYPYNMEFIRRSIERSVTDIGSSQYASNLVTIAPAATFNAESVTITGSASIPTLSRNRFLRAAPSTGSLTPLNADSPQGDTRIGMFVSLADSINDSIYRSLGNIELSDLVGDPRLLYETKYTDLQNLYDFYKTVYSPTFNYNDLVRNVEGVLDGIFNQVKTFVPASSNLITGIVIEPPVLERQKLAFMRPPIVDGQNTRAEDNARSRLINSGSYPGTRNVDAIVSDAGIQEITSLTTPVNALIEEDVEETLYAQITNINADVSQTTQSLSSVVPYYTADISQPDTLTIQSTDNTHLASIDYTDASTLLVYVTPIQGLIEDTDYTSIVMTVPNYTTTIDIRDVYKTDITSIATDQFSLPFVQPANDFLHDPGSYTYFQNESGSFGVLNFVKARRLEDIITDKGTWAYGTTYKENEVVTQQSQSGSAAPGNGKEFRCLTTTTVSPAGTPVNFVSYIAPYLDTKNWAPVSYTTVARRTIMKAILVSGSVEIVPTTDTRSPIIGYARSHYRYFRDTSTGYNRIRYEGCKNTVDTTIDGKPPVEILPSSERQLYVKDGVPLQTDTNEGGPILDVR